MLQHLCQSLFQYEPDCPGYPTERYTVDVNGVQVADLTADEVQSRITDFSNGFATLSLPLTQRLSESAVTVNMTKFNTVPTNRSDDMGNFVTEMVTWGTSAVFGELDLTRSYKEELHDLSNTNSSWCVHVHMCTYIRMSVYIRIYMDRTTVCE